MRWRFKTTSERSRVMASIRGKETKPEVSLRKALWHGGLRGYRKHPRLPGKPDIAFPRAKLVVFVDGCFWHACPRHFRPPKSHTSYWHPKIERNRERAKEVAAKLKRMGYHVVRVWEHDVMPEPSPAVEKVRKALLKRAEVGK